MRLITFIGARVFNRVLKAVRASLLLLHVRRRSYREPPLVLRCHLCQLRRGARCRRGLKGTDDAETARTWVQTWATLVVCSVPLHRHLHTHQPTIENHPANTRSSQACTAIRFYIRNVPSISKPCLDYCIHRINHSRFKISYKNGLEIE